MAEHSDLFEPCRGDRGGYEFRNGDGDLLQVIDWNRAAESGWANTNGFHQPELEAALEQFALTTPGVSIHRGWSFQSLTQDREGVTAEVARTERLDQTARIRSRWLVGADGANSAVRTQLGIEIGDSGFEADWLVVDYQSLSGDDWSAFVTPVLRSQATGHRSQQRSRPATVRIHAPAGYVRGGTRPRKHRMAAHGALERDARERPTGAARGLHVSWAMGTTVAQRERLPRRRRRSSHATLLGQGLCAGIRDARSLSWRMIMVHNALAASAVLDTYGPERLGHVRELIDEAVAAGRVICEQDPGRAAERDAEMRRRSNDPGATPQEPPHPRLGEPSLTWASGGLDGRSRRRAESGSPTGPVCSTTSSVAAGN